MTFFPIFIPMGSGGPIWPVFAATGAFLLGAVGIIEYLDRPSFYIDLHTSGNSAVIEYNHTRYLHLQRIIHHNTECLVKKGYTVNKHNSLPLCGSPVAWIGKDDFTAKQFINDCKECNAYAEIDYEFKRFYGGSKKYDATKRLKWSSCRVRRELQ
jgi:hypothetical protein